MVKLSKREAAAFNNTIFTPNFPKSDKWSGSECLMYLVEKETNTHKQFEADIRERIAPFNDVDIVFTSVKTKQRIFKALELAKEVYDRRKNHISTSKLNDLLLPIIESVPPPAASRGRYIKIKYITQLKTQKTQFAFFCNLPDDIKESYRRFLENTIRSHYDFTGVPIQLFFRKK